MVVLKCPVIIISLLSRLVHRPEPRDKERYQDIRSPVLFSSVVYYRCINENSATNANSIGQWVKLYNHIRILT